MSEKTPKPALSDSDVGALQEELEEKRHRAWAWDRIKKGAKWTSVVVLGVVALADAIGRAIEKVVTWLKP